MRATEAVTFGMIVGLCLAGCGPKKSTSAATSPDPTPITEALMDHAWIDVPRRRVTTAQGHELAVFDSGGDGIPVLLVHGLGSNSAFWQKQLTGGRLEGHRLIAPDLPGWGDSDQPDGAYTPSWYAGHIVGLLDALQIERAHVVGHSMGGQAAIMMALDHPDRVATLALSAPAGVEVFTAPEGAALRGFWTEERLRDRSEKAARASYGFVFARWDDDVERLLQARMAVDQTDRVDGMIRAVQKSVGGMLDEPVRDRLGELSMPVLYVYGAKDKMIPAVALHPGETPKSIADAARTAIEGLQVSALSEAGHTPHHDQPIEFDQLLSTFLTEHEAKTP